MNRGDLCTLWASGLIQHKSFSVRVKTDSMTESFVGWSNPNTVLELGLNPHKFHFCTVSVMVIPTIGKFAVVHQEVSSFRFKVLPLQCHLQSASRATLY